LAVTRGARATGHKGGGSDGGAATGGRGDQGIDGSCCILEEDGGWLFLCVVFEGRGQMRKMKREIVPLLDGHHSLGCKNKKKGEGLVCVNKKEEGGRMAREAYNATQKRKKHP
jgi:hypothetical protein